MMNSGNFRLYLLIAALLFVVGMPMAKSFLQEMSLGQDLRRIRMEYSMYGAEAFSARLDELIRRAPLNPAEVKIQMKENRQQAKVMVEIRYLSRMRIFFYALERQVLVQEELPLVPL